MPLFSIIIPLYNKEHTITNSIGSVLDQSFQDFEIIIVDDGSTDSSADKVRAFADPRIKLFSQQNAGPSAARNHGIREATGEWIVFLDADDQLTKTALESFHKAIAKAPLCTCIYSNAYILRNEHRSLCLTDLKEGNIKHPFKEAFFHKLLILAGTTAIKRTVMVNIQYNEAYRRMEDTELHSRLRKQCKCYRINTPTVTVYADYSQAAKPLSNRDQDFMFHIDLTGKSFWEKMCLYEVYLGAKNTYRVTGKDLYHNYDNRYILLFLNRLLYKKW